ncbi:hypothetical protein (Partial), partial [Seminavis robusta]|eukprot:Sro4619_g354360.1 n/a (203) ;mRNA; r:2-611
MAKPRLGKNAKVIIKKQKAPGIIVETLGKAFWKVELVDRTNGKPTGAFVELKSQMIRHPKEGEFPATVDRREEELDHAATPTEEESKNPDNNQSDESDQPADEGIEVQLEENSSLDGSIQESKSESDEEQPNVKEETKTDVATLTVETVVDEDDDEVTIDPDEDIYAPGRRSGYPQHKKLQVVPDRGSHKYLATQDATLDQVF